MSKYITPYDKFSPANAIKEEQRKTLSKSYTFRSGKLKDHSFCETCQTNKPNYGTKPCKGWKCNDCKLANS